MKVEIETTFSFKKLKDKIKPIVKRYRQRNLENLAELARENIKNGVDASGQPFKALSENTLFIREKGLSRKARPRKSESTAPLIHSGKLLRSIKATKTGIRMKEYGTFHFEDRDIVENNFTKAYKKRFGKDLSKGRAEARNFMPDATNLPPKEAERIIKLIKKALKK